MMEKTMTSKTPQTVYEEPENAVLSDKNENQHGLLEEALVLSENKSNTVAKNSSNKTVTKTKPDTIAKTSHCISVARYIANVGKPGYHLASAAEWEQDSYNGNL